MGEILLSLLEADAKSGCGCMYQHSAYETAPKHTHDFYEIFYVFSGKAIHIVNDECQMLVKGSLVLIRPQDVHEYNAINDYDFEIISMGFTQSEWDKMLNWLDISPNILTNGKLPPHVKLTGVNQSYIESCLYALNMKSSGLDRFQYYRSLFPRLFYTIIEGIEKKPDVIPFWVTELIQKMSKRENYIIGLSRMLQLSNYSQEHLTRSFNKYIHMTPTEFINANRINYVAQLLVHENKSIIDACYMAGFSSMSHFYKTFSAQFGCTPKQFICKHRVDPLA